MKINQKPNLPPVQSTEKTSSTQQNQGVKDGGGRVADAFERAAKGFQGAADAVKNFVQSQQHGKPPIMKVRADVPLPGQEGGQPHLPGGNGPIMKIRADVPLPGQDGSSPKPPTFPFPGGNGPIMKFRADEPMPNQGGGFPSLPDIGFPQNGGPIMKFRADEPLPGSLGSQLSDLANLLRDLFR